MEKFRLKDIETIVMANHTGMTTDDFQKIVNEWMQPPNIPDAIGLIRRWSKPMLEVIRYLGDNGYRAYIVNWRQPGFRTGVSANGIWDSRPEDHRIGAADSIHLQRSGPRRPVTGKLLLNNNFSGKAEDIYVFLGKHPRERSAIRPATGRCWNIRSGRRRSSDAACLTTTPGASLPMVRRKVFPTQGSGRSRKPCVTRH